VACPRPNASLARDKLFISTERVLKKEAISISKPTVNIHQTYQKTDFYVLVAVRT
jgi:hypothetical protein